MIRVAEILPAGSWEGAPDDSIALDRAGLLARGRLVQREKAG